MKRYPIKMGKFNVETQFVENVFDNIKKQK